MDVVSTVQMPLDDGRAAECLVESASGERVVLNVQGGWARN
ncbi:MAG: hypothetical protein AB7G11_17915 [Phycisphaerales bacterium]